ncbi:indole-3-glycerol phosphate synthase TrpC [Devriesea agamarum]|uniref:indole-3-glycerol phosphate synthase TrpC n=1 Tax=Devriesea agamarum TaxID=472569 RepID=UPI00071DAE91|nr:indole-3-glycerol phosphate synthase TrpC [Devriesea agamarum]
MSVLDDIICGVRDDLSERQRHAPMPVIQAEAVAAPPPVDVLGLLATDNLAVIAEVKRASPSKGKLAGIPDPASLAAEYEAGGAAAISVLTEQRRFNGSLADLDAVRSRVKTPILRKDFIVDEYQVFEARAHGADLVLLIVAALDHRQLHDLYQQITGLGMRALVETHDETELERALDLGALIIGVNARDLTTLEVDPARACEVIANVPTDRIAIGESGVAGLDDAKRYAYAGADAILVGEALVTGGDPRDMVTQFTALRSHGRNRGTDRSLIPTV